MADLALFPVVYETSSDGSFKSRRVSFQELTSGDLSSAGPGSKAALVNQFLLALFTPTGSVPSNPTQGTGFSKLLINYNESTAYDDVALCLLAAEQQVKSQQVASSSTGTQPTQNRLHKIELIYVDISTPGTLKASVKLIVKDGTSVEIEV